MKRIILIFSLFMLMIISSNQALAQDIWVYSYSYSSDGPIWDCYLDSDSCWSGDYRWECQVKVLRDGNGHAIRTYAFVKDKRGIREQLRTGKGWENGPYIDDDDHAMQLWNAMQPYIIK